MFIIIISIIIINIVVVVVVVVVLVVAAVVVQGETLSSLSSVPPFCLFLRRIAIRSSFRPTSPLY